MPRPRRPIARAAPAGPRRAWSAGVATCAAWSRRSRGFDFAHGPSFAGADRAAFLLAQAYRQLGDRTRLEALAATVEGWHVPTTYTRLIAFERRFGDNAPPTRAIDDTAADDGTPARPATPRALQGDELGRGRSRALGRRSRAPTRFRCWGATWPGAALVHLAARAFARGEDARPWLERVPAGCRYTTRALHLRGLAALERGDAARACALLALALADSAYGARREVLQALAGAAMERGDWNARPRVLRAGGPRLGRAADAAFGALQRRIVARRRLGRVAGDPGLLGSARGRCRGRPMAGLAICRRVRRSRGRVERGEAAPGCAAPRPRARVRGAAARARELECRGGLRTRGLGRAGREGAYALGGGPRGRGAGETGAATSAWGSKRPAEAFATGPRACNGSTRCARRWTRSTPGCGGFATPRSVACGSPPYDRGRSAPPGHVDAGHAPALRLRARFRPAAGPRATALRVPPARSPREQALNARVRADALRDARIDSGRSCTFLRARHGGRGSSTAWWRRQRRPGATCAGRARSKRHWTRAWPPHARAGCSSGFAPASSPWAGRRIPSRRWTSRCARRSRARRWHGRWPRSSASANRSTTASRLPRTRSPCGSRLVIRRLLP